MRKSKQVIESKEYATFQNALASVLKVSHSELANRINQVKSGTLRPRRKRRG